VKTQPTDNQRFLDEGDFIVSKTDTKGKITYGNQTFIRMSGYSEEELLGAPHNILRHPDMPRVVFKLLWDRIQSGQEIFAYVKNLCKDGSFYWVFTNVTASYDENGTIIGYYSVRRKPKEKAVLAIEPLYKEMLRLEASGGMNASLEYLLKALDQQGVGYDEFIASLQK
jgi:PAS domain S-box-containing protein